MKNKKNITYYIILVLAVIALLNIISDRFFVRLDLTKDNRYTLSNATKNIIKSLDEPVTITAYFSENLPANVAKTRSDFKDLLIEYSNLSRGKIVYQFINPNKNEKSEKEAMKEGIQPVIINMREKDQVKQQKAFLGAVITIGEKSDVIPFMKPGSAMEYALSSSIKKLSVSNKPSVGLLQGNGEPSIKSFRQVLTQLSILYNVEPVTLTDSVNNLKKFKTVAIVAPTDSFPAYQLHQLDDYLAGGGRLFIAYNRVKGDLSTLRGTTVNTGLESWLNKKGLIIENNFIIDASCASVGVRQQQGVFSFQSQIQFPYIPVITNFADNPITKGLESVVMEFASSMTYAGDSTITFTPLAKTSKETGTLSSPLMFNVNKRWNKGDFPLKNLTVAALLDGKLSGNKESKMVVVSDGNFPVNSDSQKQIQPDNVNLMANSIDYLSDDTGLIELRTKGVTSRPLDQISDSTKTFLKYLNFLLPLILVIILGIIRLEHKRNLRIKRMEEGYV